MNRKYHANELEASRTGLYAHLPPSRLKTSIEKKRAKATLAAFDDGSHPMLDVSFGIREDPSPAMSTPTKTRRSYAEQVEFEKLEQKELIAGPSRTPRRRDDSSTCEDAANAGKFKTPSSTRGGAKAAQARGGGATPVQGSGSSRRRIDASCDESATLDADVMSPEEGAVLGTMGQASATLGLSAEQQQELVDRAAAMTLANRRRARRPDTTPNRVPGRGEIPTGRRTARGTHAT